MSLLIKNGTIVTATDFYRGDVYVEGERITTIGTSLSMQADRVIDADGKYVLPGGIDVHTHLDMPFGGTTSADDFESGTIAAAHGGTTTIVDFAIQYHGQTLHHAWETWMKKAEGKAAIDYGFHMIVTELTDQVELEMDALVRQGVTSFKLFMAYPGVFMLDDASIFKALLRTGKNGGTICMHAENGGVIDVLVKKALAEGKTAPKYHALTRPARAEAEATHRAIAMAEIADVPIYIVHLSAAEALEMVTEARDRGLPAFAETCPQYLFLSYDNYEEPGFEGAKYVMSPPLRPKETQDRLWRGLAFNDLQAISTDHCPFCMKEQKMLGEGDFSKIPNGAPGIETRMSLVYDGGVRTGRISLNRFVELTSTSPAKIFGLFPRKGTIAPGSDADIVIFDPERTTVLSAKTLHMKVDYNPYEGREVTGVTDTVISRGQVVIDGGKFIGRAGGGSFLKRNARSLPTTTPRPAVCDWRNRMTAVRSEDTPDDRRRDRRALEEAHHLRVVGAAQRRSHSGGARQGRLLLDARGQALHRLQQPADVREHRPRRSAGDQGHPGAGRDAAPTRTRSWPPSRARGWAAKLAELAPGDIDVFFFTNGGAEANENAFKIARAVTGRQKILARYRSYHGGTAGGDLRDRRSAPLDPAADARRRPRPRLRITASIAAGTAADASLRYLEEVIQLEGPQTIAGFILEPSPARTASSFRPTATCRACARCATATAS